LNWQTRGTLFSTRCQCPDEAAGQALRVLETGQMERVGSSKTHK